MLASLYPGSDHVRNVGLKTADDAVIWDYAVEHGLAIVTKDIDFFHRSMILGHPPKVVWIRSGNCSTSQLETLLRTNHAYLLAFDLDVESSFVALV
jgi:predicted nuclease of predicted toxin-antitoxin system